MILGDSFTLGLIALVHRRIPKNEVGYLELTVRMRIDGGP